MYTWSRLTWSFISVGSCPITKMTDLYTVFPLTEAGSQIQAESLIEAGGLRANTIELIAHPRYFALQ